MIRVTVEIPNQPDLEVLCRQSDPIQLLQEKIFYSRGLIANFYKLHFNDEELFSMQRVQDYAIHDGNVIKLSHWNELAIDTLERELYTLE
jgi:hypothetical protein